MGLPQFRGVRRESATATNQSDLVTLYGARFLPFWCQAAEVVVRPNKGNKAATDRTKVKGILILLRWLQTGAMHCETAKKNNQNILRCEERNNKISPESSLTIPARAQQKTFLLSHREIIFTEIGGGSSARLEWRNWRLNHQPRLSLF